MSESVSLGSLEPAHSRHAGRRSTLTVDTETIAVGTATGGVRAFERNSLTERWRAEPQEQTEPSLVSAAVCGRTLVVGERSAAGHVRAYDLDSGARQFCYETGADLGPPQKQSRFFLPFVVDIVTDGDSVYVAARRYERDDGDRTFTSVVYCFDTDGSVRWRYQTDASAISLDGVADRLAVAYNRCPGEHQEGLVILDTATGRERWSWDPDTDGQRRVGDVSLRPETVALTSHGDFRGYCLDLEGAVRWCADLATPTTIGEETLYAYPNHVHATEESVVFVTGNTYAENSRETDGLHPREHTIFGYVGGEQRWCAQVGGFAHGLDTDGDRVAVPSAQHFRTRDPGGHGLSAFAVDEGRRRTLSTDGVVTATALDGDTLAFVEEPVSYHDEEEIHGGYQLHSTTIDALGSSNRDF